LQQLPSLPAYGVGKLVTLPGNAEEAVTMRQVQIAGPSQDPMLPEGQARITVVVEAPADLDWPAYAPTLLLPSGQAYLPSETMPGPSGAELRYLVPLPTTDLSIAWDLTIPTTGQSVRWRTTLALPVSRVEALRGALAVLAVQARTENGALTISVSLVNHGPSPLQLASEDIVLMAGERRLPTPEIGALITALAPGERRTLAFTMPAVQQGLTLTIGTQTYRIASEDPERR
jgi:hypothetical protein